MTNKTIKTMGVIILKKGVTLAFYVCLLLFAGYLMGCSASTINNAETIPDSVYKAPAGSQAELYKDMFVTLLSPYIDKEIRKYYDKPYSVALFDINFLEITRPHGYRSFVFRVKLEVHPFTGAHNCVGTDHITFLFPSGPNGQVKVEKFEHIKTYQLPPHVD